MEEIILSRYADLRSLDMKPLPMQGTWVGMHEHLKDFNVYQTEIICDTEEQWKNKIADMRAEKERREISTDPESLENTVQ